jgi:hypothetical protein
MCQDNESPTLGVLPPQRLRNSTRPERKEIAKVEIKKKLSNSQELANKKEKGPGVDQTGVKTTTGPPTVAESPAQLTNNSMGITPVLSGLNFHRIKNKI